jgi:general secretion pathway protein G
MSHQQGGKKPRARPALFKRWKSMNDGLKVVSSDGLRPPAARRKARGFTLIELMVVLVIMGVLAALIVPNIMGRTDEARQTAAKTDIATIMQALKLYKLDNGVYPSQQQGLQALVVKPSTPPIPNNWKPYLEKLPTDPWGNAYQYLNPGVKGPVDVFSYGADGKPGGEGANADIGSWQ